MNTYNVSFSLFECNGKSHFSNCKASITGESFDDAVDKFKQEKLEEGWIVDFLVEGDMFEINLDSERR